AAGYVDVRVVNPDGKSGLCVRGFSYDSPPTIERVEPGVASIRGGTTVSVFGANFLVGCTVSVHSEELLTKRIDVDCLQVTLPEQPGGTADGVATTPDAQSPLGKAATRFEPAPVISSVDPAEGPPQGGTEITIRGRGFQPGCAVTFFGTYALTVRYDGDES